MNQYALLIRETFKDTHLFLPSWPNQKRSAVALSHDVDYPEMICIIEALRYFLNHRGKNWMSKLIEILRGRESFWRFKDWVELETNSGLKSAFYFCGFKGSLLRYLFKAPDPFYDVRTTRFREVMKFLDTNGFEVGLHSSFLAYRSADDFLIEKSNVEEAVGKLVFGNRHHYFHMNPENPAETALIHQEIGFVYDSSISYEKHSGYRYGVGSPFHLYDTVDKRTVATLQLPITIMDDHLFGQSKYSSFENYQSQLDSLLAATQKYETLFMADYHVRVLNDTFFPNWGESYKYLLKKIRDCDNFYCDTPLNIATLWLEREKKIQEFSKDE